MTGKVVRLPGLADDELAGNPDTPSRVSAITGFIGMSSRRFRLWLTVLSMFGILLLLWRDIFIPIGSGHAGVLWSRFGGGTVMDRRYGEGYSVIWPWDRMAVYDLRLQRLSGRVQVLTSDGLQISMRVTVRFRPLPGDITMLHRSVGPGYRTTVIWPDVIAAVRHVVRRFKPDDLSVIGEAALAGQVETAARRSVRGHWIDLDRVLITEITLPSRVQAQIQEKLADEQRALAGPFLLRQAELKRRSWAIEAEGARAFRARAGMSLLDWRNAEALERLAQSSNSKVVVLGGGSRSVPLVLDTGQGSAIRQSEGVQK